MNKYFYAFCTMLCVFCIKVNNVKAQNEVWESAKEVTSDTWEGTKDVAKDVWDGTKNVASDIKDGVTDDKTKSQTSDKNTTSNNCANGNFNNK